MDSHRSHYVTNITLLGGVTGVCTAEYPAQGGVRGIPAVWRGLRSGARSTGTTVAGLAAAPGTTVTTGVAVTAPTAVGAEAGIRPEVVKSDQYRILRLSGRYRQVADRPNARCPSSTLARRISNESSR